MGVTPHHADSETLSSFHSCATWIFVHKVATKVTGSSSVGTTSASQPQKLLSDEIRSPFQQALVEKIYKEPNPPHPA
jgi:hypothetical protein